MALLSVIRRWHYRDHLSIREIARRTGLSRNTIRKYLRSDTIEPRFKVPERPSKLDPFADRLVAWLRRELDRPRKQKRTVKQLHADLVSLGYDGSYGRVAAFARDWRDDYRRQQQISGRGTFVPLSFAQGEAFQFDWSEDWAIIAGVRTKLQVAHFKLSYSRAFILRAYLLQTHEMLFDAHNHAFRVLGGVPRRGIYDNMRTAVDKVGRGKERNVNTRFLTMVSHYLFEAEFCNPAAGWEKGQVEKNVQDARRRLWQPTPQAESLDALNLWLEQRCTALWQEIPHGIEPGSVAEAWADEVECLMPVGRPFDGFVEYGKRVSPTCLVHLERNRYSVPAAFANRPVSLRVYPDHFLVVAEGQVVCEHQRIIDRSHDRPGHTVYDWRHYLAVVQRKPGALRNGAPFLELPDAFQRLQRHLLRNLGGDREMVDILALVLHHDEQVVLTAVAMALDAGVSEAEQANPAIAADIAERLLAAGRAPEAMAAIERAENTRTAGRSWPDWERVRIEALDALGHSAAAQQARWAIFERDLNADYLRAHLERLPDFDDEEAETRAIAHARAFPGFHRGLAFLVNWPAHDAAAAHILERQGELDGDHYWLLTPTADALEQRHPLAATLMLRAMINFALEKARTKRYGHAARHLKTCEYMVKRIEDWHGHADHDAWVADLRQRHGRKSAFWQA